MECMWAPADWDSTGVYWCVPTKLPNQTQLSTNTTSCVCMCVCAPLCACVFVRDREQDFLFAGCPLPPAFGPLLSVIMFPFRCTHTHTAFQGGSPPALWWHTPCSLFWAGLRQWWLQWYQQLHHSVSAQHHLTPSRDNFRVVKKNAG